MIAESSIYLVYIQRIEALTLQLQDIKSDLKETVDLIAHISDITPDVGLPSLQQITLNIIIKHHSEDVLVIREKINRTIDLVLYQVPHLDPCTPSYCTHSLQAEIGRKQVFNTPVVLTLLKTLET